MTSTHPLEPCKHRDLLGCRGVTHLFQKKSGEWIERCNVSPDGGHFIRWRDDIPLDTNFTHFSATAQESPAMRMVPPATYQTLVAYNATREIKPDPPANAIKDGRVGPETTSAAPVILAAGILGPTVCASKNNMFAFCGDCPRPQPIKLKVRFADEHNISPLVRIHKGTNKRPRLSEDSGSDDTLQTPRNIVFPQSVEIQIIDEASSEGCGIIDYDPDSAPNHIIKTRDEPSKTTVKFGNSSTYKSSGTMDAHKAYLTDLMNLIPRPLTHNAPFEMEPIEENPACYPIRMRDAKTSQQKPIRRGAYIQTPYLATTKDDMGSRVVINIDQYFPEQEQTVTPSDLDDCDLEPAPAGTDDARDDKTVINADLYFGLFFLESSPSFYL